MPSVVIMKHRIAAYMYLSNPLRHKIPPCFRKHRRCVYKRYLNWVCTVKSEVSFCDIEASTGTEVTQPYHCRHQSVTEVTLPRYIRHQSLAEITLPHQYINQSVTDVTLPYHNIHQ